MEYRQPWRFRESAEVASWNDSPFRSVPRTIKDTGCAMRELRRESALLRGIPVGQSRKPLSRVSREYSDQLKQLLVALGELENDVCEPERVSTIGR